MSSGYIAIDLGAESGRAIVGTLAGGRIALEEVHRFPHEIVRLPSGLHWDVTGLWREICRGLKKSALWAKENGVQLVSVGVDTWGVDWALLDKSGELLGLPHAYRDPRNRAAHDRAVAQLGIDKIYRTTGIQLMPINSLYSLFAHWTDSPEIFDAAEQLLFIPDLFHFWLSGVAVVEATIASTSQMVDCQTRQWATNLLDPLGVPTNLLGPISPPGATVGSLRPEIAAETGLPVDLKVVAPGSHDTASAIASVPAEKGASWCYLSSGTWSLLGAELDEPCVTADAQAAMFTNEFGVGGKIRFLKNITGLWLVQECRRDLLRQGQALGYAELTQQASEAGGFRTLIDPAFPAFQTPGNMLQKIQQFAEDTNQPLPESPGQFIRCCLESLALVYRQTVGRLEEVLGRSFSILHVVGGGGQNKLLNQMTADATGKTVCVGPYEATAVGNTLTQALAAGQITNLDELRGIVADSFDLTTYQPSATDSWQMAYVRYNGLVQ